MGNIIDTLEKAWPVIASIGNVAAVLLVAWLQTKFVAKSDHDKVAALVDDHVKRLVKLEADDKHEPSRAELNRITSALRAEMSALQASQKALGHQLTTLNTYLHSLLENELRGAKK